MFRLIFVITSNVAVGVQKDAGTNEHIVAAMLKRRISRLVEPIFKYTVQNILRPRFHYCFTSNIPDAVEDEEELNENAAKW